MALGQNVPVRSGEYCRWIFHHVFEMFKQLDIDTVLYCTVLAGIFSSGALSLSPTSTETALREESANLSERR
jgi:hypothetical protein